MTEEEYIKELGRAARHLVSCFTFQKENIIEHSRERTHAAVKWINNILIAYDQKADVCKWKNAGGMFWFPGCQPEHCYNGVPEICPHCNKLADR